MARIPNNISDVVLYKIAGDKGGGSFKLTINPVNVQHPQSLRHVQPICEFTAPNSRENLAAAMFYKRTPCKEEMEDVMHRRCVLMHLKLGEQMEVFIVKNTYQRHTRKASCILLSGHQVRINDEGNEVEATLNNESPRLTLPTLRLSC